VTRKLLATVVAALLANAPVAHAIEGQIAADAAWCWFQDPRAVYHDGAHRRTYAGYVTAAGDIGVVSYDHDAHELRRAVVARAFQRDDHASPALEMLPDGRLMVLWSAHRGRQLYFRTTRRPEDVFDWGDTRTIGTNAPGFATYTYANPVRAGGRLFVFWRAETGTGSAGQAAFSSTGDGGATWAPGQVLLQNPAQRPYVKYAGARDTIHVAYTEGHPNAVQTTIRYAAFRDGRLYRADGSALGDAPLTAAHGERVYGGAARAWVWDVAADSEGRPVIVYATFPGRDDHRYRYARWNGSRWLDVELTAAGGSIAPSGRELQYSGGIALDHEDPSNVYLSRQVNGVFEIERWRTPDRGRSWTSTAVTRGSMQDNVRPVVPRGAPAHFAAPLLWMSGPYPGYTSFATSLRTQFGAPPVEVAAPPPDPQTPPPGGGPGPSAEPPPAPGPAGAEPEGPRAAGLRITVSRAVVLHGRRVRIAGTLFDRRTRELLDGRTVLLYARRENSHRWSRSAKLRTDSHGRVAVKRSLNRQTDFRFVYPGSPLMTAAGSRVARVYVERAPSTTRAARD
jgi:hypothetical protein